MAAISGKNVYITFSSVVLSGDYTTFNWSEDIGTIDASAGSDSNRTYLTTLKDGTAAIATVHQAAGTGIWGILVPGTSGTLIWGPEGTAANKIKHYVTAFATARSKDAGYADLVVIEASWQYSGAITDTTWAA